MIIDLLANASPYRKLSPGFASGLDWLARFQPETPDGRYEIDGDAVYALVQSYDTVPATEKKYEAHRVYADIQYVAVGKEVIEYAPINALASITDYDATKDFLLFADPVSPLPLPLTPGMFAIFLPADGHKPCLISTDVCRIKKVVLKVRI
ncbi:MAG TPA: YhcH/YjgK/YiaL family protein [Opitutaceae bacterium]|nr:YhcH/YjgK/YiaL family protein [Opitutaceae bacterium]